MVARMEKHSLAKPLAARSKDNLHLLAYVSSLQTKPAMIRQNSIQVAKNVNLIYVPSGSRN